MFEYYGTKKDKEIGHRPSGSFQVAKIRIVEKVPKTTFKKKPVHCFQVGNKKEVLYFCTSTEREREEWMETFRIAAFELKKNKPLPHYHTGAFGKKEKDVWSCCNQKGRETEGCEFSTPSASYTKKRKSSLPLSTNVKTDDSKKALSRSLPSYAFNDDSDLVSRDSGWCEDDKDSDDSEDGSDTDELESLPTPASLHVHPSTWPSKLSLQSADSGRGSSVLDLVLPASLQSSVSKPLQHSTTHRASIVASSQAVTSPITFTRKTSKTSPPEEGCCTTILYKGADSMVTATSTGKVLLTSRLNTATPQSQSLFTNGGVSLSVAAWGKSFAIGSSELYYGNLDEAEKIECYDNFQDRAPKLVAIAPDGSLFFAAVGGSSVEMVPQATQNHWMSLKPSTKPITILQVPGQILSLAVSHHPNQPWLAVGFTSLRTNTDFVSLFNYKTKSYNKPDIEIGQSSDLCLAFTHDGEYLYIGSDLRIQCFSTETSKQAEFSYTFSEDGSITTMCCSPVRHHLAVGLKNGKVKVFVGEPSQSAVAPYSITDTKLKSNGAITSLSYSRDGMKVAVGFQNRSLQIWKASKPPEERPLTRTGTLIVTDKGQTYHSKEDGYTITIPEGAVKPGIEVPLHYGVAPDSPYGPYEFKDGAQPVSTIISLCPEPADTVFLKPIEVTVPHFIACKTPEDCENLSFYKAEHTNFEVENGAKIYLFEKVKDSYIVHFTQYCEVSCSTKQKIPQCAATLYTTHFCDLCIAMSYSEEYTKKARLSLSQIVPKQPGSGEEYKVIYCLSYFLKTCTERVDEQYPATRYNKEERVVSFSKEASLKVLKLDISREGLRGGWQLSTCPDQCQIAEKDVCFWNDDIKFIVKELVVRKKYPPTIPLHIRPGRNTVREGVVATVLFSGVKGLFEESKTQFTLQLVRPSLSPSESSRSVSTSTTASYQSAASVTASVDEPMSTSFDKFKEDLYEIANSVNAKRLALALVSESSQEKCPYLDRATIETIESFLEIARSSSDNFSRNYDIIAIVFSIAKRFRGYITAVRAALDRLGYSPQSHSLLQSHQESASDTVEHTAVDDSTPLFVNGMNSSSASYSSLMNESTCIPQEFPNPCSEISHQMDAIQLQPSDS